MTWENSGYLRTFWGSSGNLRTFRKNSGYFCMTWEISGYLRTFRENSGYLRTFRKDSGQSCATLPRRPLFASAWPVLPPLRRALQLSQVNHLLFLEVGVLM